MIDPVVSVSLRCLLALLFATAAWHKLADRNRFAATLRAYQLVPRRLVEPLAVAIPTFELGVAGALLFPVHGAAAVAAAALLSVYTLAIAVNLVRGRRQIDCGCFGPASRVPLRRPLLLRNGLLLVAATMAVPRMTQRQLVWLDGLTIAVVVLTVAILWNAFWRLQQTSALEAYP